jgi:hypothetical protein
VNSSPGVGGICDQAWFNARNMHLSDYELISVTCEESDSSLSQNTAPFPRSASVSSCSNDGAIREFKLRVQTSNGKRQGKKKFTLQGNKWEINLLILRL